MLLSTLFDSYKDNIDVPYKEEFIKIIPVKDQLKYFNSNRVTHTSGFLAPKNPVPNRR
jgi:hypothetical protein